MRRGAMSEISIRISDDEGYEAGIEINGKVDMEDLVEAILKYLDTTGASYDSNSN